jgi:hypothetical protein
MPDTNASARASLRGAERVSAGRDELRQDRQRAAHAGGRHDHGDDRDDQLHGELHAGAIDRGVVGGGVERAQGVNQRIDGQGRQAGPELEDGEHAQRPGQARCESSEQEAAEAKAEEEGRQRGGDGRRRGPEEHREAAHPQDFVSERSRARQEKEKVNRG